MTTGRVLAGRSNGENPLAIAFGGDQSAILPVGPESIRVGNPGYVFDGFESSSGLTECLVKICRNAIFIRGEARILFLAHIAEAGQNLAVDLFLILEDPN